MRQNSIPDEILAFKKKVNHWRQTRKNRGPMPEPLWEEAISLSRLFNPNQVLKAASLSSTQLSKRLKQRHGLAKKSSKKTETRFVSVDLPINQNTQHLEIEIENSNGKTLRIKGNFDINTVISNFME